MYGDWFILTNTNSALSRQRRIEPFGFSLKELPKEINHIDALHIYDSTLSVSASKEGVYHNLSHCDRMPLTDYRSFVCFRFSLH